MNGGSPHSQTELNGGGDIVLAKFMSLQQNASLILSEPKEDQCTTGGSNVAPR
jgi:hypothetical protein